MKRLFSDVLFLSKQSNRVDFLSYASVTELTKYVKTRS
jgi:hypothetical protein|nr:MAG TPA: hypothetical protein [Caudoviricetes sp.]